MNLEDIQQRLQHPQVKERLQAIQDASGMGEKGLLLVLDLMQDENEQVRSHTSSQCYSA